MVLLKYTLNSSYISDYNTEIRYSVASARADGTEIICYLIEDCEEGKLLSRSKRELFKILNSMKKEGLIQFIVKSLSDGSAEAEYVKNKYSEYIDTDEHLICVKI